LYLNIWFFISLFVVICYSFISFLIQEVFYFYCRKYGNTRNQTNWSRVKINPRLPYKTTQSTTWIFTFTLWDKNKRNSYTDINLNKFICVNTHRWKRKRKKKVKWYRWCSGPALGIGRECDGLGPMPLEGPKFFYGRGCI